MAHRLPSLLMLTPMYMTWGLALFIIVILLSAATTVDGWSFMAIPGQEGGMCDWNKYVPECPIFTFCGVGDPNANIQYSPISFPESALTDNPVPEKCMQRLVRTDASSGRQRSFKEFSALNIRKNGGGAVTARCKRERPLLLRYGPCDEFRFSLDNLDVSCNSIMEVMDVIFYNSVLHQFPPNNVQYPGGADLEVEVHLKQVTFEACQSIKMNATPHSRCESYVAQRMQPDAVVSFAIRPTDEVSRVPDSIISRLLLGIISSADQVAAGASMAVSFGDTIPLLPTMTNTEMRSLQYEGSLVAPPCSQRVQRIVLVDPIQVPISVAAAIRTASSGVETGLSGYTHERIVPVSPSKVVQHLVVDVVTEPPVVVKKRKSRIDTLGIPIMVGVNCFFGLYLVVLVMARFGILEVPLVMGGLDYPVNFYSPAYEEVKKMEDQGIYGRPGGAVTTTTTSSNSCSDDSASSNNHANNGGGDDSSSYINSANEDDDSEYQNISTAGFPSQGWPKSGQSSHYARGGM